MLIRHLVRYASQFLLAAASPLLVCAQTAATAAQPLNLPVVAPAVDCASLASADISPAVGAATYITAASVVDAKPAPYCKVLGYVEPAIKFEVRLPVSNWTQRLVQVGCGGLCGNIRMRLDHDEGCMVAQNGQLALTSTDMGHSGGNNEGTFGDDYQLRIDYAYRAVHLTTVASKALIAKYYGQAPKFSYFMGCSDGGREALMEAQRFPDDFNGITAGDPAMNDVVQNTFFHGWNVVINMDAHGNPILVAGRLPILHKAIVEQCDALDGLKDGLISDPLDCHPSLAAVECKPGQDSSSCLTPAEVHVAEEIYRGAHDAQGGKLVISGPLPGSELSWARYYIPYPGQKNLMGPAIAEGMLKHLAYDPNPSSTYTLADLKFDRASFDATTRLHSLYDSTDPDLKPFAGHGGKLILWHGFADGGISPMNTIAYYTAMQNLIGAGAVDRFARLYLFPGGYRCSGGEGPFDFDLLMPIMLWVERGIAPGALIASHFPEVPPGTSPGAPSGPGAPAAQPKPDRTRPIYPYPYIAQYTGKGSIDDAANFVQGPARPAPAVMPAWFGSSFYSAGYEMWCSGNGASFQCKNSR